MKSLILDADRILEQATGRWPGIFARLGIDVGDGRHKACPICGPGRNSHRFRFTDMNHKGMYICSACGAGNGIQLVQRVLGVSFPEACEEVAKIMGTVATSIITPESNPSPERLRELFKASRKIKAGDPVTEYLLNRGLSDYPETLRYSPKCWEYETKMEQQAMLAVFALPDGEAVTICRTFIRDGKKLNVESPKKTMPPLKNMKGGSIRLYPQNGITLGVAEGVETAIAVHQMHGIPVWATTSAHLMESFIPPAWAKRVEIYADNDGNFTGQKAAYTLANRLVVKDKITAAVAVSKLGDFLEDFNQEKGA